MKYVVLMSNRNTKINLDIRSSIGRGVGKKSRNYTRDRASCADRARRHTVKTVFFLQFPPVIRVRAQHAKSTHNGLARAINIGRQDENHATFALCQFFTAAAAGQKVIATVHTATTAAAAAAAASSSLHVCLLFTFYLPYYNTFLYPPPPSYTHTIALIIFTRLGFFFFYSPLRRHDWRSFFVPRF